MSKFAVAIHDQGRFAPTCVGDFQFLPDIGAHVWKAKTAETMKDLAEQMNGAFLSWKEFGNPFINLRVIEIGATTNERAREENDEGVTVESTNRSLVQANGELRDVIAKCNAPRRKLELVGDPG